MMACVGRCVDVVARKLVEWLYPETLAVLDPGDRS